MKFKIDENLSIELIDVIKSAGYSGMTAFEQRLNGKHRKIMDCR
jgi:predicted nuclease of predicted toxin-antitoxin system